MRRLHSFIFTGGIIMTGNRPFPDLPELDAVKTRISYQHVTVSDNEMMALMRHISLGGYRNGADVMDPVECNEICQYIFAQCLGLRRLLDARLLVKSFERYLLWREFQSGCIVGSPSCGDSSLISQYLTENLRIARSPLCRHPSKAPDAPSPNSTRSP